MIFRIANAILGKATVFVILLGWFFVVTGVVFLIRPKRAGKKLSRFIFKRIKWVLLFGLGYGSLRVVSWSGQSPGIKPKLLAGAGVLVIMWLFFSLKKRVWMKLQSWFEGLPEGYLRYYSLAQIAAGAAMIMWKQRIW